MKTFIAPLLSVVLLFCSISRVQAVFPGFDGSISFDRYLNMYSMWQNRVVLVPEGMWLAHIDFSGRRIDDDSMISSKYREDLRRHFGIVLENVSEHFAMVYWSSAPEDASVVRATQARMQRDEGSYWEHPDTHRKGHGRPPARMIVGESRRFDYTMK